MDLNSLIQLKRERLEQLEREIADPRLFDNRKRAEEIMRERASLTDLLEKWRELETAERLVAPPPSALSLDVPRDGGSRPEARRETPRRPRRRPRAGVRQVGVPQYGQPGPGRSPGSGPGSLVH